MRRKLSIIILILCILPHVAVVDAYGDVNIGPHSHAHQHGDDCNGRQSQDEDSGRADCHCLFLCTHCCHMIFTNNSFVGSIFKLGTYLKVSNSAKNRQNPFLERIFRPPIFPS